MKKFLCVVLLLFSSLLLVSCSNDTSFSESVLKTPAKLSYNNDYYTSEEYLSFVSNLSTFSSALSSEFMKDNNDGTNISLSPLSIIMALSLAAECSSNNTRSEILDALGVTYKELIKNIGYVYNKSNNESYYTATDLTQKLLSKEVLTNSIWFDNELKLKDDCLLSLSGNYQCYSYEVDFNNANSKANKMIREFVKENTNGLIDQDFNLDTSTAFALINTLYLKDLWSDMGTDLFYTNEKYEFKNSDNSITNDYLLSGYYKAGKAYESEKFKSFYTFTARGYKITFILPNAGYSISNIFTKETLQEALNARYITSDIALKENYFTRCFFPEFKTECDTDLKPILEASFGIHDLFDSVNCDYSNITDTKCYCTEVKHVTKLRVDKEGVEGAAVTIMTNATSSAPLEDEFTDVYYNFIISQAFGFVISYNGIQLFTGIVNEI